MLSKFEVKISSHHPERMILILWQDSYGFCCNRPSRINMNNHTSVLNPLVLNEASWLSVWCKLGKFNVSMNFHQHLWNFSTSNKRRVAAFGSINRSNYVRVVEHCSVRSQNPLWLLWKNERNSATPECRDKLKNLFFWKTNLSQLTLTSLCYSSRKFANKIWIQLDFSFSTPPGSIDLLMASTRTKQSKWNGSRNIDT